MFFVFFLLFLQTKSMHYMGGEYQGYQVLPFYRYYEDVFHDQLNKTVKKDDFYLNQDLNTLCEELNQELFQYFPFYIFLLIDSTRQESFIQNFLSSLKEKRRIFKNPEVKDPTIFLVAEKKYDLKDNLANGMGSHYFALQYSDRNNFYYKSTPEDETKEKVSLWLIKKILSENPDYLFYYYITQENNVLWSKDSEIPDNLKLFFEKYSYKYIMNHTEKDYTVIDHADIKLLKTGTHFYDTQKKIHEDLANKKEDCIYYISYEAYVLTLYKLLTHIDKNEKNNFDEYVAILKKNSWQVFNEKVHTLASLLHFDIRKEYNRIYDILYYLDSPSFHIICKIWEEKKNILSNNPYNGKIAHSIKNYLCLEYLNQTFDECLSEQELINQVTISISCAIKKLLINNNDFKSLYFPSCCQNGVMHYYFSQYLNTKLQFPKHSETCIIYNNLQDKENIFTYNIHLYFIKYVLLNRDFYKRYPNLMLSHIYNNNAINDIDSSDNFHLIKINLLNVAFVKNIHDINFSNHDLEIPLNISLQFEKLAQKHYPGGCFNGKFINFLKTFLPDIHKHYYENTSYTWQFIEDMKILISSYHEHFLLMFVKKYFRGNILKFFKACFKLRISIEKNFEKICYHEYQFLLDPPYEKKVDISKGLRFINPSIDEKLIIEKIGFIPSDISSKGRDKIFMIRDKIKYPKKKNNTLKRIVKSSLSLSNKKYSRDEIIKLFSRIIPCSFIRKLNSQFLSKQNDLKDKYQECIEYLKHCDLENDSISKCFFAKRNMSQKNSIEYSKNASSISRYSILIHLLTNTRKSNLYKKIFFATIFSIKNYSFKEKLLLKSLSSTFYSHVVGSAYPKNEFFTLFLKAHFYREKINYKKGEM